MPLKDVVIAALSRPAGKVVESPVRELIDEALRDRGYASPAEIAALKEELSKLGARVGALPAQVGVLEQQLGALGHEARALREALSRAEAAAAEARAEATAARAEAAAATARAEAAEARLAALESASEVRGAPASAEPVFCRVAGCGHVSAGHGFCRAHLLAWRAGRLPGFVSPEGLVEIDGGAARVAREHAGLAYSVDGGRVRVVGKFTAARAL